MCNFLNITDSIRQAYSDKLPRRHFYTAGFTATTITGGSTIALGVLLLLVGLKGCSIPGVNSIHNHLGTVGTSILGGAVAAGGCSLLLGEGYIIWNIRQKNDNTFSLLHEPTSVALQFELEFTETKDLQRFLDIVRIKGLGLFLKEGGYVPYPNDANTFKIESNVITIHLPATNYFTDSENGIVNSI